MPKRPVHPPASRAPVSVGARPRGPLVSGDLVQLIDAKGNKYTITLKADAIFHSHRGQLAHNDMIGRREGIIINSDRAISYLSFATSTGRLRSFNAQRSRGRLTQRTPPE